MTVIQRPLKGSRLSSFYPVKSLPSLSSLDSAFQLQEYISLLIRFDVHDVQRIISLPGKFSNTQDTGTPLEELKDEEKDSDRDGKGDVTVEEPCWIYEQLRRLAQDLSHPLITTLQEECTRQTCPEMKAGEWLYLCVAHGNEGAMEQCCAIDYIIHTVDSATALLNSPRAFPSRLSIPPSSYRHFSSLARRLGRIFAHAYFHHREAFEQAEAESSLYARFLALTSKFDLVPPEFLVIPLSHADGAGPQQEVEPPRLLGAALDPHKGRQEVGEERGANSKQDFEELSLEPNNEGSSDLLRSPAGPDGQRRRNRTDTMIFSEAVNIAEDLAKAQTEEELEASTSLMEIPPIEEVAEVPLISEVIPLTDNTSAAPSDPSLGSTDHIPTDEAEDIPLPAVTDSELVVPEDSCEDSDEEVVPEEEILDPAVIEPPVPPEISPPELPSTTATEPLPSESVSEEKKPEPMDVSEPAQLIPEASEPREKVEAPPGIADEDEDDEDEEEELTSASGPSELEAKDEDDDESDEDDSQPADEPEVDNVDT
ncbi:Mob1/phocein [Thelephora terrestris]|uniref:Mob1/phocein n=1 Tax=Thelephora terrestris TaxID=56493 RepID=A0A9P6HI23_9AGAM|nr:Mob1/phocein [Thelephora terrestris]